MAQIYPDELHNQTSVFSTSLYKHNDHPRITTDFGRKAFTKRPSRIREGVSKTTRGGDQGIAPRPSKVQTGVTSSYFA